MAAVETRSLRIKDIVKSDLLAAGTGALVLLAVLLLSLAPIIYVADSAVFTTASYYLSTAFPPGYPVLITLDKLFTFLPAGSIAYRANLADAVSACLAFLLVFALIRRLGGKKALALSAAFLSALLPLTFSESLKAEVFTLNTVFCFLALFFGLEALEKEDARFLYAASLLFGLGTGHHHTLALLLVPVAYPAVKLARKRPLILLYCLVFLAAGFLVNMHIVLRSFALNGSGFNFSIAMDWAQFSYVFFRKAYSINTLQSLQLMAGGGAPGLAMWWQGFWNLVKYVIAANFGGVMAGVLLAAAAVLPFTRKKKDLYLLLAVVPWLFVLPRMTLTGTILSEENIYEVRRYFVPLLYMLCVILALQADRVYLLMKKSGLRTVKAAGMLLVVPLLYIPSALRHSNANDYLAYDKARDTLSVMPPESAYMLYGDNPAFGNYYIQWIERYREDVLTFTKIPHKDDYATKGRSSLILNGDIFRLMKNEGNKLVLSMRGLESKAVSGKLFVPNEKAILKRFAGKFEISKYGPLSYVVSFNGRPSPQDVDKYILDNFEKINFERALGVAGDPIFSAEIKNQYGFSLLMTLPMKKPAPGDAALGDAALRLVDPDQFLPYYVNFLEKNNSGDPLLFLRWIEQNFRGTKMADIANVLEYEFLSRIDKQEAAKKYDYLEKKGLLIYLYRFKTSYKPPKGTGIKVGLSSSSSGGRPQ